MTSQIKQFMLWIAPLGGACVSALMLSYGWAIEGALTAGLTLLCALWWIFGADSDSGDVYDSLRRHASVGHTRW